MSKTYRREPADPDRIHHFEPTHLQTAESNRHRSFGWYNLTGMGDTQPTANAQAADVLVFLYREVRP